MLTVTVLGDEQWDEVAERFTYAGTAVLEFEHSLVALSKWEAKYHKLFLTKDKRTEEEMFGYIKAMLLTPNVPEEVLLRMSEENVTAINDYINDPMTGTIITNLPQQRSNGEQISSELIYFWMNQYQIDQGCENWHLNRLFTLIKVHYAKSQKPQKMSPQAQRQRMAELNARRRAKLGTTG